jgi:hypothetical protein
MTLSCRVRRHDLLLVVVRRDGKLLVHGALSKLLVYEALTH